MTTTNNKNDFSKIIKYILCIVFVLGVVFIGRIIYSNSNLFKSETNKKQEDTKSSSDEKTPINSNNIKTDEEIKNLKTRLDILELKEEKNSLNKTTTITQTQTQTPINNKDIVTSNLSKMPSFKNLIGFKNEREAADRFLTFLKNIDSLQDIGKINIPTGILLYGVPGTGKTTFARALAKEANMPFYDIPASRFSKSYVGEAPQMVRDLFNTARKEAQKSGGAIIFIDECEEVFKNLADTQLKGTAETANIVNEFKSQMTSIENDPKKPVFIIGSTNHIKKIDEAIKSRFNYRIEVKPGNLEDRKQMLEFLIKKRENPYSVEAEEYLINVINLDLEKLPPYSRSNRALTNLLDEIAITFAIDRQKTTPKRTHINIDDIKKAYLLQQTNLDHE